MRQLVPGLLRRSLWSLWCTVLISRVEREKKHTCCRSLPARRLGMAWRTRFFWLASGSACFVEDASWGGSS